MEANKEFIGEWFYSDNQEKKLSGNFSVSDDGICRLKVMGNFDKLSMLDNFEKKKTINGILLNGEKVTLFNCFRVEGSLTNLGFCIEEYSSNFVVVGDWYNDDKNFNISEIITSYNYLNYWIGKSPLHLSEDYKFEYNRRKPFEFDIEDMQIVFNQTFKMNLKLYERYCVNYNEFVKFKFKSQINCNDALEKIYDFADFLTLCIGMISFPINVRARDEKGKDVEFILKINKSEIEKFRENQIYIKFTYIKDIFEEVIKTWFNKKDMLKPITGYFVDAHQGTFVVPMSFLKIVQAIEAYSRRMRNNERIPRDEFEEKIQSIIKYIPNEDDKKLVRSIISNEPRLRERLKEIFKEINYILDIGSKKRKSLIDKIVNTRNYYTHFDKRLEEKKATIDEIYYLSQLLKLVLRILLLQELGVSKDLIEASIKADMNLNFIKNKLGCK